MEKEEEMAVEAAKAAAWLEGGRRAGEWGGGRGGRGGEGEAIGGAGE